MQRAARVYPAMEHTSLASYPDARCNDGSNAGYYFLPAPSNRSRDWVVMLDSGGWCWDEASCLERCATAASKCSSLLWSDVHSPGGILASTVPRVRPSSPTIPSGSALAALAYISTFDS